MKGKGMFVAGLLALYVISVVTIVAVNVSARPQRQASMHMMSSMNGQHPSGSGCSTANGHGMMGNMMNRQSMNSQQCRQHMGSSGQQTMCGDDHHEQCEEYMG